MGDDTATRFASDVEHHEMTVLRDDGLYRHVRFVRNAPDFEAGTTERSSFYWFELITWPGVLAIHGDMGTYTFARTEDMFGFFRLSGGRINPSYWAEKAPHGTPVKEFSPELFEQLVTEHIEDLAERLPGLAADVKEEILDAADSGHEAGAHQLLADYRYYADPADRYDPDVRPDFEFHDTWEWDLRTWTYQFLWCCYAIVWGIAGYDGTDVSFPAAEQDRTPVDVTVTMAAQPGSRPVETVELPA